MSWPEIPPEYAGHVWPYRVTVKDEDGNPIDRVIASRFPPADTDAFSDFRTYAGRNAFEEHPEWFCRGCKRSLEKPSVDAGKTRCRWCVAGRPKYEPSASQRGAVTDQSDEQERAVALPGLAN